MHRHRRDRLPGGAGLALIPAAAFAVHQLRYQLAYGSKAGAVLSAQGHAYLHSLVPWLVLLLGVGLSSYLRRIAHARNTGDAGAFTAHSMPLLWGTTSFGLVMLYAIQESLEELFATGHPTGFAGIFGHGGWWALPAACVAAVVVVAVLRLGRSILRVLGALGRRRRWVFAAELRLPSFDLPLASAPLALRAAGRAPPLA